MRVLALNPYHGGSHRAFIDGWIAHSRHRFDLFTLPAHHWKWRMRHGAMTFADELSASVASTDRHFRAWDAIWCTDMLDLAQCRGLLASPGRFAGETAGLPGVCYFHENQLTYPDAFRGERDLHFALTNMTSALAANAVWFNSAYHRDAFCAALGDLLRRMPDHAPLDAVDAIRAKAQVQSPGIEPGPSADHRSKTADALTIAWVSRWEHDKDPDTFFSALDLAARRGVNFRLNVLGESFTDVPPCFNAARNRFVDRIDRFGYVESPDDYRAALAESDVVISTAKHEFFGIAVLEAVDAGCFPLVPRTLAYPETLSAPGSDESWFHDGSPSDIAARLVALAAGPVPKPPDVRRYHWPARAAAMDEAFRQLVGSEQGN